MSDAIFREHRLCGTPNGYDGCYSHPIFLDHCRADGMPWPCDVARLHDDAVILATFATHEIDCANSHQEDHECDCGLGDVMRTLGITQQQVDEQYQRELGDA